VINKPLLPLVVTEDNRLGGVRRFVFHPSGKPFMQVPVEILNCVAFISCKRATGMKERGTVFFVSVDLPGLPDTSKNHVAYAITAKHVIDGIERDGADGMTHLRMNTREHGLQYINLPLSAWTTHQDRDLDVAVAEIDLDEKQFDHMTIPRAMFMTAAVMSESGVGSGDDLFFPGLFKHHKGTRANVPIVRVGNIAAMPGELIETTNSGPVRAYLAEAHSIGGLSGSPVFVHLGMTRFGAFTPGPQIIYFIGLVHGHFNQEGELDSTADDIAITHLTSEKEPLNTGIAIVIPSDDIEAVLDQPQLVAERERHAEQIRQTQKTSVED
jgi:hypothetical protein